MSLAITGLTHGHRRGPVLGPLTFSATKGQVLAVIGPNGAGKTTLLRLIAAVLRPSAGSVALDGTPVASLPPAARARAIGYLPQGGGEAWNITVRALVELGRAAWRPPFAGLSATDHEAIDRALHVSGSMALADRLLDTLSGGERARVNYARLLAGQTDWLLIDEPLAHLDPPQQEAALARMRASADHGQGVIVVLHDLEAAARVADRVLLLSGGAQLGWGTPDAVLTEPLLNRAFAGRFRIDRSGGALHIHACAEL